MTRRRGGLLASLIVGAACVVAAGWIMHHLTRPDLVLRLAASESRGRIGLRFSNAGTDDILLDTGAMEYFLVPLPQSPGEYAVQVRNTPYSAFAGDTEGAVILRPGDSVDVGDVTPYLERLAPGDIVLTAIYSVPEKLPRRPGSWRGFVRSTPFTVKVTQPR